MAREHSGILDANSLFGDLPHFMTPPASSRPPPPNAGHPWGPSVAIYEAPVARHSRRDEPTARSRRRADPAQARLIAIVTCGSIALAAALAACVLYATTPIAPTAPAATHAVR
jgi:hypothetical protein